MFTQLKKKIKQNPKTKQLVLNFIIHPVKTRPQWWIRLFRFVYMKCEKGSVVYRSVRKDIVPFNHFRLGKHSVIESFSIINNMVGDIIIGDNTRIGLGNTIIGPVTIGKYVNLAQHVTVSGLNHIYQNPEQTIISQGVTKSPIIIEDDVWVGANAVILSGITIGKHSIIAAGTVVSHSVPPYSIVAGNPGHIIKQYDFITKEWRKINPS